MGERDRRVTLKTKFVKKKLGKEIDTLITTTSGPFDKKHLTF